MPSLNSNAIPENSQGKQVDLKHVVVADSIEAAKNIFERARTRMMHPDQWKSLSDNYSAEFSLYSEGENNRPVSENDYLVIDTPAPGPKAGEGHDWVKVENILISKEPGSDSFSITLRPAEDPEIKEGVAHFFDKDATSTFILTRTGNKVTASYHGRNEVKNTKHVSWLDKLRNLFISSAAKAGLSEIQWTNLLEGFLKD